MLSATEILTDKGQEKGRAALQATAGQSTETDRRLPFCAGKADAPRWNSLQGTGSSTHEDKGPYLSFKNILHKYMSILVNLEI